MKPERTIKLGSEVEDLVTGFKGIAAAETEWLNGCFRISVRPNNLSKEGKVLDDAVFDALQLKTVKKNVLEVHPVRDNPDIELGEEVKDSITGFTGIAIARTIYISGSVNIAVQPKVKKKEEKVPELESFNALNVFSMNKKKKVVPVQKRTGGPLSFNPKEKE